MRTLLITFFLITCAGMAQAASPVAADAWVRHVPAQANAAGYLTLTSPVDDTVTGATSDCCATVELHEMTMDGDTMHMQKVDRIAMKAGEPVTFEPMGYHLMLIGLKQQPKVGGHIPVTFTFESGATAEAMFAVKPLKATATHDHGMKH